ncbi:MAG: 1,4-dihydroxy-2-naphthoate octaprenyltransferase [Ignavibacteria bacterium]|nr:1,4-dihydroxy-2-naphthoate octaprenyltransferase [Ignavibacteria bacterium]
MSKLKYYIKSFRLRTLPLSVSGIIMGSFIAFSEEKFNVYTFVFAIATTLSLQILSNLANELGDIKKGTDNANRVGPIRSLQQGKLSISNIRQMIFLFIMLSIVFGLSLIYTVWDVLTLNSLLFIFLGLLSILSALAYTLGKNAYGYKGLGDIFVFVFFGLVSTVGSYFLMSNSINFAIFLPAFSVGFLSVAVLNLNNMRDVENDKNHGKITIPVKIGLRKAKIYHIFLIISAFVAMICYMNKIDANFSAYLFILSFPIFLFHISAITKETGKILDRQMPILTFLTLLFTVLVIVGLLFF